MNFKTNKLLAMAAMAVIFTSCGGGETGDTSAEGASCEPACAPACAPAEEKSATTYSVDPTSSTVEWSGLQELLNKKHTGTVTIKEGSVTIEEGKVSGGKVIIDMTSIIDTDLTEEEGKTKLEGHLMSDDFFNSEEFPEASFEITGVEGETLTGDLKIRGISAAAEVTDVIVTEEDGGFTATGTLTFDRTKHDVKYGSGTLIDGLGDNAISDFISISVTLKGTAAE